MQNLDQIRAANALKAAKAKEGQNFKFTRADVAGFPALIIQNGLLSAFAYATEEGRSTRAGLRFACDCTADHLSRHGIPVLAGIANAVDLIEALSAAPATSSDLQRATAEALLFFGYLKRFAAKEQPNSNSNTN
jgi:CRISPR/Cas system CMR-associated protein Cmr5 small subunit